MSGGRRRGRRSTAVIAALAVGAGTAIGATAANAGTLKTYKGGYRDVATNTNLGFAFGLPGAVMEAASNSTFTSGLQSFPATDASGATSLTGQSGNRWVREKTPPAGWQTIDRLNWDGSTRDYEATADVPSGSGDATARIQGNDVRFINRFANPPLPQTTCGTGIDVLLVLDTSGSTDGYGNEYNAAAKTFITSLSGTSTRLKISSFATTSSPGASTYDLSTVAGQNSAKSRVDAIYPDDNAGDGWTNWDAALQDAALADVDVVVMVTDGNPTIRNGSGADTDDYRNVAFGIASANLAKNPDRAAGGSAQTIMAVGVGGGIGVENLKAISGPIEGTDYTTASDPAALAGVLKRITEQICPTDLEIVKKGPDTVNPGQDVTYDVTVTNKGAADIPYGSIQVTDPGATLTPPANPPAKLAGGASLTWTAVKPTGQAACASKFSNTATVALVNMPGYSDTVAGNNSSTWTSSVVCPVDLSVVKNGDETALAGGPINYDITVTNNGPSTVPFGDITVSDPQAALTPPENTNPLAPGESRVWTGVGTAPADPDEACGMEYPNTATVSLGDLPGYVETSTSNNTSTWKTNVTCPVDLLIEKSGSATVQPGGTIAYTVTVRNVGPTYPVPVTSINVTDLGLDDPGLVGPTPDVALLGPGQELTWTGSRSVPPSEDQCEQTVTNTATVALAQQNAYTLVKGTHEAQAFTSIVCPLSVGITKTATQASVQPGGTATYDVTVTNNGAFTVPFGAIEVSDPGSVLTPPADTSALAPGASRVWTATKPVPDDATCGGAVENTATVDLVTERVDDSSLARASAVAEDPISASASTPVVCPVQVSIAKATGQSTVTPGGTVSYAITVTNTGAFPVPGSSISVADPGAVLAAPADAAEILAPGATRTWTATKDVANDPATCGTPVTNTASVSLDLLPAGLQDTGAGVRASSASPVTVDGGICAVTPATVVVARRPAQGALGVTKTGPKRALAGARATYRITVTNSGAADVTGVVVRDVVPATMAIRSTPAGAQRAGNRVTWTIGTLAPGQSVTKVLNVTLLRTTRGRACNVATATGDGSDTVRARACTTVQVGRRPATPVTG